MRLARWLLAASITLAAPLALAQESPFSADLTLLPKRVQATHAAILAAAKTGQLSALDAVIAKQGKPIRLGFGDAETAAEFATANSATGDGLDVLAETVNLLETPYEAVDLGDGQRFYVWPYLAGVDLPTMSDADKVVAYQLVAPADLDGFIDYGGWLSLRVIIDADGTWSAWVAGD